MLGSVVLPSNVSDFERTQPPTQKKGGRGFGGLAVLLVLLVVLGAVVAIAVTRLPTGSLSASRPSSPTAPAAAPAAGGTAADAATQQAIQQAIQQLDEAQAQAIATDDPKVMAATATPEFYQEQLATNQDLLDNGVTEVKLVKIEWGDIVVNGNTATATAWETWSTTFSDGTTEQSRDRNVYTLVQQNGAWKVKSDEHPDQQQAPAGGQNPAP